MQQSIRVAQDEMVRLTRMAARGGLLRGDISTDANKAKLGEGLTSVSVRNNVAAGSPAQSILVGNAGSPKVMPGTDVLVVRGVFNTPLYQLNPAPGAALNLQDDLTGGFITVENPQPTTGVTQNLTPLKQMIDLKHHEALVVNSPLGSTLYAVVEVDPDNSTYAVDGAGKGSVRVAFKIVGGTYNDKYGPLGPNGSTCTQPAAGGAPPCLPDYLRSVAQIGILEEYRYYVRQVLTNPGDPNSEAKPRLSRARVFPGTEVAYLNDIAQAQEDIADDIIDLQVALAIDVNNDNIIPAEGASDEWLFNDAADDPTNAAWSGNVLAAVSSPKLDYVRVTTAARTAGRDFQFEPTRITKLEDHTLSSTEQAAQSQYRLRTMQTVIDLRNL
jgi:hypothetical protein